MSGLKLRPYQNDALQAIDEAEQRGIKHQLLAMPTGCGKTVVFSKLVAKRGGRGLILAHREELLKQAHDKLIMVTPELRGSVGIVRAERDEIDHPIVVGSVPTLARKARLERLAPHFQTVIVDEAHHSTADTYCRVLDHVGSSDLFVGVTATPERNDSKGLQQRWDEVVFHRTIKQMIREGYLCDLKGQRVRTQADLSAVPRYQGDYQAGALGQVLEDANAPEETAKAFIKYASDRKGLLFTPTVELAYLMAEELLKVGIKAEALDGTTPEDERAAILARLSTGQTQVVANVGVLTEGYDEPSIDVIVMACPTRSQIKYIQCVGRGTRIWPGKDDCLILDVIGVTDHMSLMSLPKMVGVDEEEYAGGTSVSDLIEQEDAAERERRKLLGMDVEEVDLFQQRRLHWIELDDRFMLQLADSGTIHLVPQRGTWTVIRRPHWKDPDRLTDQLLAKGVDLGYATGIAEDFVREAGIGAQALADPNAAWRSKPISDSQKKLLAKRGYRDTSDLNRGQASDLISRLQSSRSRY